MSEDPVQILSNFLEADMALWSQRKTTILLHNQKVLSPEMHALIGKARVIPVKYEWRVNIRISGEDQTYYIRDDGEIYVITTDTCAVYEDEEEFLQCPSIIQSPSSFFANATFREILSYHAGLEPSADIMLAHDEMGHYYIIDKSKMELRASVRHLVAIREIYHHEDGKIYEYRLSGFADGSEYDLCEVSVDYIKHLAETSPTWLDIVRFAQIL